ncbi:hypothetical protein J437_LFUL002862 [Ladona fulva]|uniref:Uncharacterized protein n=1 Tax=Ladona fulva TaxID=123851 RepID=A0A8K0K065_LADFU|nr:hypothetical protein J437_LFUL002862 [Ladona fulva]
MPAKTAMNNAKYPHLEAYFYKVTMDNRRCSNFLTASYNFNICRVSKKSSESELSERKRDMSREAWEPWWEG